MIITVNFQFKQLERRSLEKNRGFNGIRARDLCVTGNAEVTGSNPVEAPIFFSFFRLLLSNCLNWKIYCDDHSSLSNILMVEVVRPIG